MDSIIVAIKSAIKTHPLSLSGATPSVKALLLLRLAEELKTSLLVFCPNEDAAEEGLVNLVSLSGCFSHTEIKIIHLPTWEQSPYSSIAPSIRTRFQRISALGNILCHQNPKNSQAPQIILCTLAAANQATMPKDLFSKTCLNLKVGETPAPLQELSTHLGNCGYMRVETVEDPGTFAMRGDILDVFSPDQKNPFRIEFYGDLIERMRPFDSVTQRAKNHAVVSSLLLFPAREVLINPTTSSQLREKIKAYADNTGVPRRMRDPILSSIESGVYSDHCDVWAPFAYSENATLWDYLPENMHVIWDDLSRCQSEWENFLVEQSEPLKRSLAFELILPPVEELYCFPEERKTWALSKSLVCFEIFEHPESHHLQVQTNADLVGSVRNPLQSLEPLFRLWIEQGQKIIVFSSTQSQSERMCYILSERNLPCSLAVASHEEPKPSLITLRAGFISEGFRWPSEGLIILTESEILGNKHLKKNNSGESSHTKNWSGLQTLTDLYVGDHVVHIDHGIGKYLGLVRLNLLGAPADFLLIEYAQKDKLYLPVYKLNVIQKYLSASDSVSLDRLGSQAFAKVKDKVKNAVQKLAIDLVQLYAERKTRKGLVLPVQDAFFREFEAKFPFDETPDQLKAIEEIQLDLESGKIMDRLVCGDVGYGKTEVAIRAAFRVMAAGKQVVVLVPTTILAQQHELSFRARLRDYPFVVESLSRFKPQKEQKEILESLSLGKIDIIIGTHRLLSADTRFKDLGLVIIDEEHRFGVEHKEKLKTFKLSTHVLTLTATPIPRTLHMALAGLREMSIINTPPVDRLPIRTYIAKFDEDLIQKAIQTELARGGQVFFVHNRVKSIQEMATQLSKLISKDAKIGVAHGQMHERELEKTMSDFYQKKTDILLCSSIIESGLDLPTANTLIINRADTFGLAQLYQIRGRVGRSQNRAFAYLLLPKEGDLSADAKRRLEVIQRFVELGSGFSIASHDLEIRGGGDLLGASQSGHIAAVGFDLYTELLEEAVSELQGKPLAEECKEPEIKLPFPAYLSEDYVPDVHQRLSLYRRFSIAPNDAEVVRLEEELQDRFGPLPTEATNLLWIIRIKILLKNMGVETLIVGKEKISLGSGPQSKLAPEKVIALVSKNPSRYQIMPDSKLIVQMVSSKIKDLYFELESLLKRVAE